MKKSKRALRQSWPLIRKKAVVGLGFALWQVAWAGWYHYLGARFAGLQTFAASLWQLLPAEWLTGPQSVRSLWVLHSQPPFLNALYAILLNFPAPLAWREMLAAAIYQTLAWLTLVLLYSILRRLGLPSIWAVGWTVVWGLYPAFVGTAYVFSYTLWVIACMAWLLWSSLLPSPWGDRALWGGIFLLSMIRAPYGWSFLLLVSGWYILRYFFTIEKRGLSRVWFGAFLLASLWTLKNGILFGTWTSSSWVGMNWARFYRAPFNQGLLQQEVQRGQVEDIVLFAPFSPIDNYPASYWIAYARNCEGPPALCGALRPDGQPNLNYIGYIPVSRAYTRAGIQLWKRYPHRLFYFLNHMAFNAYFTPSYYATSAPAALLHWWAPILNQIDAGLCPGIIFSGPGKPFLSWKHFTCPRMVALYAVLFALVSLILLMGIPRCHEKRILSYWCIFQREYWSILLAWGIWLYGSLIYNVFEFGENPRFRLEVDILAWVLAAVTTYHLLQWGKKLIFSTITRS